MGFGRRRRVAAVSVTWGGGKAPSRWTGSAARFGRGARSRSSERLSVPAPTIALPTPRTETAEPRALVATG